jgi:ribonuclease BN (tRNA processing enzyme)
MGCPNASVYGPEGTRGLISGWTKLFPYVHEFISISAHDLRGGSSLSIAGCEVSTLAMRHHVTSLSYKFDQTLAICGDSEPLPELKAFAEGCKLLIHECSYADDHEPNGHTTPTALGRVLAGAQLEKIVLTHFYPPSRAKGDEVADVVHKYFSGQVEIATELKQYTL